MRTLSLAAPSQQLVTMKPHALRTAQLTTVYPRMLWFTVFLFASAASAQTPGSWSSAGSMSVVRGMPTTAVLNDGTVLVAGGASSAGADLYNPSTNTWTTTGSMTTARSNQAGTRLQDGRVLLVGGQDANGVLLASAEVYNPTTKTWSATGSMSTTRYLHSATLLSNGKVLAAGGWGTTCCGTAQYALTSSELWDPATGKWTLTGSMTAPHAAHSAVLLSNGDVLVTGGTYYGQGSLLSTGVTASANLYDPVSGTWAQVGNMTAPRGNAAAVLMSDGRVLVAGGSTGGCCSGTPTAEVFDLGTLAWTSVQSMTTGRNGPGGSAILSGSDVLISGGYSCCSDPNATRSSTEYFESVSHTWHLTGSLNQPRAYHTSLTLPDGTVLALGGGLATAERYYPDHGTQSITNRIAGNISPSTYTVTGTGCSPGTYTAYGSVAINWNPGATCQVTASGPTGYVFTNWSDGSTANPRTFIAPNTPTTYTANFSQSSSVAASITATGGTPQSATVNTAFASRLSATVKNSAGDPASGVLVTFTAPSGSGASGTFAGGANTATTNASGVATSAGFTANSTAGSYTVTATVPGATSAAGFTLTNTAVKPASISPTGGTPQSATVNTAFTNPLSATVKDSSGNPISGVVVTFNAPVSGASGTFAGGVNKATTNASGTAASPTFTANATAGSYNVSATVAGISTPANFALTNNPSSGGQGSITLVPKSYVTTKGSTGGQPVASSIDLLDESGTANTWSKYVEFSGQYAGYQVFTVPASIAPASVKSIQLQVNYQGPNATTQTWTWQIFNWATSTYVTVGSSNGAPEWGAWKLFQFNVSGTASNYIRSSDGQVQIQLVSNNSEDSADIDYEAIILSQ